MRAYYLLLTLSTLFFNTISCTNSYKSNNTQINGNLEIENTPSGTNSNQQNNGIKFFKSLDKSTGVVYSEILDYNHAGYLKRSDMNSAGHTNNLNAKNDRVVIVNSITGENYNVQAGSKFYWVNSDGKYFGTDNLLYDPRTDNRINNRDWVPFEQI